MAGFGLNLAISRLKSSDLRLNAANTSLNSALLRLLAELEVLLASGSDWGQSAKALLAFRAAIWRIDTVSGIRGKHGESTGGQSLVDRMRRRKTNVLAEDEFAGIKKRDAEIVKRLRIYLDTSVINFLFAEDAPDFQRETVRFFEHYAQGYDLFISDVVTLEIERDPDNAHRKQLFSVISRHGVRSLPEDEAGQVRQLALCYIKRGAMPKSKVEDALHVAYATVHEMDVLLSWNFKHLANVNREARILAINLEEGYRYPLRLLSPLEVLYE